MPTREIKWGDVQIRLTTPRSDSADANKKYEALADLVAHNAIMMLVEKHNAILTKVEIAAPPDTF